MFILENVFIVLVSVVLLIGLFTFFNILTFTKDFAPSVFLTFIFFDLFFRMPFKAINNLYNDRNKLLNKINKQKDLTNETKKQMEHVLQKRYRLFISFYIAGEFSYSELMSNMRMWFCKKPFKVRVRVVHMNRKRFESKYLNDRRNDILGTS